jgi:uncharacterized surface protein with fasciclin (FAS1) repeats
MMSKILSVWIVLGSLLLFAPVFADDDVKDIVDIAVASENLSTLVTAVKAADYVTSLKNPGPVTLFAPTNEAFDKLPKGTVEGLLKPENKEDLQKLLQYHVAPSVYQVKDLKDGMSLGEINGAKVSIAVKDGKTTVNGANILSSTRASNGIVHVIDEVLLPPQKK